MASPKAALSKWCGAFQVLSVDITSDADDLCKPGKTLWGSGECADLFEVAEFRRVAKRSRDCWRCGQYAYHYAHSHYVSRLMVRPPSEQPLLLPSREGGTMSFTRSCTSARPTHHNRCRALSDVAPIGLESSTRFPGTIACEGFSD